MYRLLSLALVAALLLPAPAEAKSKKKDAPPPAVEAPPAPPPDPNAWRATPPAPAPRAEWTAPVAQKLTLTNGVPVYVVPNAGLPLASVQLVVRVGREANPVGKAGLAALTANLLDEGTKSRTASDIASTASALGASLSVGSSDELSWVGVDLLTAELGPSLDLLADVALQPKFASAEFDRVKGEILTSIRNGRGEPRDVAARAFLRALYGSAHPYAAPAIGDEAGVSAITAKDVAAFYKTWWHAGNAAFVVSGAVKPDEVRAALDARFGKWKAGKATRLTVAPPSVPMKPQIVFVPQEGAVQSVLRIGTVGPNRTSPDFMAANVAGTLVGGMFSSPINMNLRETHGWSYGAYAGFSEARDHGTFAVRTSVQADKTAPAVAEVLKELANAAGREPTAQELSLVRDNLLESLPGTFETNSGTAAAFLAVPQFGLTEDWLVAFRKDVNAVDGASAARAAKAGFDVNRLLIVVVGPRTAATKPDAAGATAGAADTTVDVVAELKALGYDFREVTAP